MGMMVVLIVASDCRFNLVLNTETEVPVTDLDDWWLLCAHRQDLANQSGFSNADEFYSKCYDSIHGQIQRCSLGLMHGVLKLKDDSDEITLTS